MQRKQWWRLMKYKSGKPAGEHPARVQFSDESAALAGVLAAVRRPLLMSISGSMTQKLE
jgi:hypothetical protein